MKLSGLSWNEVNNLPKDTLFFISIGPMEAHGPHLPVSTDLEIAIKIEERTINDLQKEGIHCVSLPSIPLGVCKYLEGFDGTISISWQNLYRILVDVFCSLAQSGFRYIMIINYHMDLYHIKAIHKAIKTVKKHGITACEPLSIYYFKGELFEQEEGEIHADIKETSLALYLFPKKVKNTNLESFSIKFNFLNALKRFKDLGVDNAYIGSPSKATEQYGQELFTKAVTKCKEASLMLRENKTMHLPKKMSILLRI